MKYVRTKDEHLLEIGKTTEYGFVFMPECEKAVHFVENGYEYVDIIKQADTIEELIEGMVAVRKSDNFKLLYTDSHIEEAIKYYKGKLKDFNVFGAIWTEGEHGEPILKSVTKLTNKKGELELL